MARLIRMTGGNLRLLTRLVTFRVIQIAKIAPQATGDVVLEPIQVIGLDAADALPHNADVECWTGLVGRAGWPWLAFDEGEGSVLVRRRRRLVPGTWRSTWSPP